MTGREYTKYLKWFGKMAFLYANNKTRMEYPFSVAKWKRQLKNKKKQHST